MDSLEFAHGNLCQKIRLNFDVLPRSEHETLRITECFLRLLMQEGDRIIHREMGGKSKYLTRAYNIKVTQDEFITIFLRCERATLPESFKKVIRNIYTLYQAYVMKVDSGLLPIATMFGNENDMY